MEKTMHRIRLYSGYHGDPIFVPPGNYSTYYNYAVDKQCRVPIRSRNEILKELGILKQSSC